jgi:hypothetical protein
MRRRFEYVIYMDKKEVWRGLNPKERFNGIREKNTDRDVGIAWESKGDDLIA